jgi:hypothetical protein
VIKLKVIKRLGRSETELQQFDSQKEAESFIFEKLREDQSFKLNTAYLLYEQYDLLKEYTEKDLPQEIRSDDTSQSSRQSFNPTPFVMAPRPGSLPKSGFKEEDDKDKQ